VTKWTQLSIQHGWSAGSPELTRSGSNHSSVIPFRYDLAKVTFALSRQNALARSWKQSSHWTKKVLSFLGSVLLKVSSSQTLAWEEDSLVRREEQERQLTAMVRLWKTARLGSSSSVVSRNLLLLLLLLSSPGSCYDHVQLRVLSGHSGRIAALQLSFGHPSLTPVTVVQLDFC